MPTVRTSVGDLSTLIPSFHRHLRATNRSPKTQKAYLEAANQLDAFLREAGMPTEVTAIRREHVESFIEHLLSLRSASTAATRYRGLQQLFRFLVDEGEITESPMARMSPPSIPEAPVPVLSTAELRGLLKACEGKRFEDRRDTAIVRLFVDGGLRVDELASLKLDDVDFDANVAIVEGKGRRTRSVPFDDKTAMALDRYLRMRRQHKRASEPWLWLGIKGRLTDSGVAQMLRKRGAAAGIEGLHPHQLRHTMAHRWLAKGGSETGLMRVAGWKSRQMLQRYGASAADERAREEHRRLAQGDEL